MQKFKLAIAIIASCLLTAGLTKQQSTYATVPKINELVSVDSSEALSNAASSENSISASGQFVAFSSGATNLVVNDTNNKRDVFVRDRTNGNTTRVSISSSGTQGDDMSYDPSISYDGRYVIFTSKANTLVATAGGTGDIYVHDRTNGTTQLVSVSTTGSGGNYTSTNGSISADGRFVVFQSSATNLVSGITTPTSPQIYVRDLVKSTTQLISADSSGNPGNSGANDASISCDGGVIAFYSNASNLTPNDTSTNGGDIFVDVRAGGDTLTNLTASGDGVNLYPSVSCDGNYVAFHSGATNLVSGDTNGVYDIFRYSRINKSLALISKSTSGSLGNQNSQIPSLSGNGRYVAYYSSASNLVSGDINAYSDVFITDTETGITELLSVNSSSEIANGTSAYVQISTDGKFVSYANDASNLVSGDTNGLNDIYVSQTGY